MFICAPYLAARVWRHLGDSDSAAVLAPMLPRALLFAAAMMIALLATGLYSARQRMSLEGMMTRIITSGLFVLVGIDLHHFTLGGATGHGTIIVAAVIAVLSCVAIRMSSTFLLDEAIFKRRILVYGAGANALHIARLRRRADQRGFSLVGFVPAAQETVAVPVDKIVRPNGTLLEICRQFVIAEIVVAMDDRRCAFPKAELLECRLHDIDIIDLASFLERETGTIRLEAVNASWLIFGSGFSRSGPVRFAARALDIAASMVVLLVTWPLMLMMMIAIKLEDGIRAPVFYRQARVGLEGRVFNVIKFRSMRVDAEKDGLAQWALEQDRRITRVGAALRPVRLDELPQIFNVLAGHMRIVGPRPERPEFVTTLNDRILFYRERHSVKPGITGWAQLCYPYGCSERDAVEKLQYDLFYVKNHSFLFDLSILVQTAEVILWRKGSR